MELITLDKDITVQCETATSFPMGIGGAFKALEGKLDTAGRIFYGISRPDRNTIVYKAAIEVRENETNSGFELFVIRKGTYLSEKLLNWKEDESSIGKAFQTILQDSRIDPNGACVEKYINSTDVICMVRLDDKYVTN